MNTNGKFFSLSNQKHVIKCKQLIMIHKKILPSFDQLAQEKIIAPIWMNCIFLCFDTRYCFFFFEFYVQVFISRKRFRRIAEVIILCLMSSHCFWEFVVVRGKTPASQGYEFVNAGVEKGKTPSVRTVNSSSSPVRRKTSPVKRKTSPPLDTRWLEWMRKKNSHFQNVFKKDTTERKAPLFKTD